MTAKRKAVAAALLAAVTLLGGCGMPDDLNDLSGQLNDLSGQLNDWLGGQEAWTPQESDAVSIASDGSVTEMMEDTLDQSYYDVTELESMITSEVAAYNAENGADSIKIESFEHDGTNVSITLWYASCEDYASFNNTEFYCGTMIGAQIEGYLFEADFSRVSEGELTGGTVDYTSVFEDMSAGVVIVQAPMEVHVEEGAVTFISTNAEMISADTVNANGEQEEEEALVLPSSKIYEEETTYEEEKLANRVYIIYNVY
ncbi:MAG: hypothetical protein LUI13_06150 [Lachnospiraceae bacterium]|nr:hypothetical protein [Lachnospiraceae bacterium]